MQRFRHGRIVFAGDAAHVVSPFGARGANGGVQDVDNLVWKLALVVNGDAPAALIDSYDAERTAAADENIRCSTRATDFITPKSAVSQMFRDATLALARHHAFARRLVNSGRLSVPAVLARSALNTADAEPFAGAMVPGAPAADAPVEARDVAWFLECLGDAFTLVIFDARPAPSAVAALAGDRFGCRVICVGGRSAMAADDVICIADAQQLLVERYDARPGTCYLFRPDQHVCARWRRFDVARVRAAIARATANA
jgi:3-(3-hydroxy-phenyl)propionate hydroxylase